VAWVGSIGLQAVFIYYMVYETVQKEPDLCDGGNLFLRLAGIGVMVAKVFGGELGQTCNLYRWCMLVSDLAAESELVSPGPEDEHGTLVERHGCFYEKSNEDGVDIYRVGTVMPRWLFRFSMMVVLCKTIAALLHLYVSVGFVMASDSNEDLILNSLATVFVLEIDDIGFDMLVPYALKQALDNQPALTPRQNHWMYTSAQIDVIFASFGLFILFVLASAHLHYHWCEGLHLGYFGTWLSVPLVAFAIHFCSDTQPKRPAQLAEAV